MKDTRYLQQLNEEKQYQIDKANSLRERCENGTLSREGFESQMRGVSNSIDIINNEIEEEIEKQGLSEEEYLRAKDEWNHEQDRER